ncbi:MAG: hypothetical protein PWQ31_1636 [Eubacteriales bacterium]|nr:hypothetical protein [Eubacteriales bacterium]
MAAGTHGLGVIEANVGHTIGRRFKHSGASWTRRGAVSLAKVRYAVRNGEFIEVMRVPGPPVEAVVGTERFAIRSSYWCKRDKNLDSIREQALLVNLRPL